MAALPADAEPHLQRGNRPTHKIGFEVRPGVARPCIDPARWAEVRAAVLSGPSFPASRVDAATLRVGRAGASALRPRLQDLNRDGRLDLVFTFRGAASGLVRGETRLWFAGRTKAGLDVGGIDAIRAGTCG